MRQHRAQGPPIRSVLILQPHRRVITKMAPGELAPLVLVIAAGISKMAPTQKATGPGDHVAHAALGFVTASRASAATVALAIS